MVQRKCAPGGERARNNKKEKEHFPRERRNSAGEIDSPRDASTIFELETRKT